MSKAKKKSFIASKPSINVITLFYSLTILRNKSLACFFSARAYLSVAPYGATHLIGKLYRAEFRDLSQYNGALISEVKT
jgi:hypothetical protein